MPRKSALSAALELYSAPSMARQLRRQALPDDVLMVIKAAAGDSDAIAAFPAHVSNDPERVQQIAAFYVQQLMFMSDTDDYRLLGLLPDAAPERVREHKRWLLRWLHPDRNNNRWEQIFFLRVTEAAERMLKAGTPVAAIAAPVVPAQRSEKSVKATRHASHHHAHAGGRRRRHSSAPAWLPLHQGAGLMKWAAQMILAVALCGAAAILVRSLFVEQGEMVLPIFQEGSAPARTGT